MMDFLVIGAQKCATSWLFYCLQDHPGLHLPAKKREIHYLGGDLYEQRGADWYFSLLSGAQGGQKIGDVSVEYIFDPRSPRIVHYHAPQARLVAVVREPVERAVSAYRWQVRKGQLPLLDVDTGLRKALEARHKHELGDIDPELTDVLERGFYDQQLERYLEYFEGKQLLVVAYDEIRQDPAAALARIYDFLGVDAELRPPSLERRPKKNSRVRWLVRLERLAPRSRVVGKLVDNLHRLLPPPKPTRSSSNGSLGIARELKELYRPHVHGLLALLGELPPENRPQVDLGTLWLEAP